MIQSFIYSGSKQCQANASLEMIQKALHENHGMVWMDFDHPAEEEVKLLSEFFNFHPLAIEDCVNVRHHPKIDDYDDYLFMIFHAPDLENKLDQLKTTELDIFIGKNFVVSHHAEPVAAVDTLKQKCEKNADLVMGKGADFFLHALLDQVMEAYEPVVENLAEEVSWAEEEVFYRPDDKILKAIFDLRKDVIFIRRVMAPQRDTILQLAKENSFLISEKARLYFRDTYDVMFRIMDLIDNYRELLNGTVDAYLIIDNNRMNRVMKDLTIISAIMLPLTFIVGVYGMNFKFMPELNWKHGYLFAWILMVGTVLLQILVMKKKKYF